MTSPLFMEGAKVAVIVPGEGWNSVKETGGRISIMPANVEKGIAKDGMILEA